MCEDRALSDNRSQKPKGREVAEKERRRIWIPGVYGRHHRSVLSSRISVRMRKGERGREREREKKGVGEEGELQMHF